MQSVCWNSRCGVYIHWIKKHWLKNSFSFGDYPNFLALTPSLLLSRLSRKSKGLCKANEGLKRPETLLFSKSCGSSHMGEIIFTEPPCLSLLLWQVSVSGLLSTFKNILISPFESMSGYEGRRDERQAVNLSDLVNFVFQWKREGKQPLQSPKWPSKSHNQKMNDGQQMSRGPDGCLRLEQTCEIFLSLFKNRRGGSEPVWSLLWAGHLSRPWKRDMFRRSPRVSAARTTRLAVVQRLTTVSCCRSRTCVISSDSFALTKT